MAASPPSSLYNYWEDFENQFEGNIWSCKEQNMVAEQSMVRDANYDRASNEYAMENANTLAVNPHEQGGLMLPHIPTDIDAFDDDVLRYTMDATPPSSLYNHWVDFESQIEEEQSMSISTNESRGLSFIGDVWSSKKRKMVGDVSCNRTSSESVMVNVNTLAAVPHEQGGSMAHVPIDIDDDDVLVSSYKDFARARNKSRRTRERAIIIDVESEEQMQTVAPSSHGKRSNNASGQTIRDCNLYEFLEFPSRIIEENVETVQPPLPLPPPPPPPPLPPTLPIEPTFSCPICMSSIDEAMSTKCGHIFCKACLKAAISAQKKCPTCRAKVATMRSTHRVYLPTSS